MKNKLIILSLCPLFILTFIHYFPWTKIDMIIRNVNHIDVYKTHMWLCLGLLTCLVWFVCSAGIYLKFKFNMKYDRTEGYEVIEIAEEKDAGLNFFLTLILPLLINDISQFNGLLMLGILVVTIFLLLRKTNLYYQNPILIMLGYRIYKFRFKDNERLEKKEYIGIAFNKITGKNTVDYKSIEDNVMVIKQKEIRDNAEGGTR